MRAVAAPSLPTCPRCRAELDLVQPDAMAPDVVFGVCRCGALFRMAYEGDASASSGRWEVIGRAGLLAG